MTIWDVCLTHNPIDGEIHRSVATSRGSFMGWDVGLQ